VAINLLNSVILSNLIESSAADLWKLPSGPVGTVVSTRSLAPKPYPLSRLLLRRADPSGAVVPGKTVVPQNLGTQEAWPWIPPRSSRLLACECMGCPYPINSIEPRLMHSYVVLLVHDPSREFVGRVKDAMLAIGVIVIIFVVLLISMDRVSSRQTTNGRSLKEAEGRFLNRFLYRRRQRPRR
jgi:hypothetical protein